MSVDMRRDGWHRATRPIGWASTALPLTTCVMVWGMGDAPPTHMAWLPFVHDLIGAAASAWTIVQLTMKWLVLRERRGGEWSWPGPGLLVMYVLLTLQPLLATASTMLHGARATLFGIPLPRVLASDLSAALQVDRMHGYNAIVLLSVMAVQLWRALRVMWRLRRTA